MSSLDEDDASSSQSGCFRGLFRRRSRRRRRRSSRALQREEDIVRRTRDLLPSHVERDVIDTSSSLPSPRRRRSSRLSQRRLTTSVQDIPAHDDNQDNYDFRSSEHDERSVTISDNLSPDIRSRFQSALEHMSLISEGNNVYSVSIPFAMASEDGLATSSFSSEFVFCGSFNRIRSDFFSHLRNEFFEALTRAVVEHQELDHAEKHLRVLEDQRDVVVLLYFQRLNEVIDQAPESHAA